jgi:diguanylate cyclase (GGDEF)-like protein
MWKKLYSWRYYSVGKDHYNECINKLFMDNLRNLFQANVFVAVIAACLTAISVIMDRSLIIRACVCGASGIAALLLAFFTYYRMQTAYISTRFIYITTTIYYANTMWLGIYLSVWASPDKLATIFLCFLICALLLFINPPQFNLILTLIAVIAFTASTIYVKSPMFNPGVKAPDNWVLDIINTVIAGTINLYFTWYIGKLRLGLELSTIMLENERDGYYDQSTIDELTKLKNRRDFQQTFKRYLSNYRTSDNYLCVAIIDIDFFKFYNDHYGHPGGDECLRSVGRVLNSMKETHNVYTARVGGEEFALLWFEAEISHVDVVISHLQSLIKELKIPHEKSRVSPYVSISMGVFVERSGVSTDTQTMYDMADKALYNAKEGGRNCAIISGSTIEQYKIAPAPYEETADQPREQRAESRTKIRARSKSRSRTRFKEWGFYKEL